MRNRLVMLIVSESRMHAAGVQMGANMGLVCIIAALVVLPIYCACIAGSRSDDKMENDME
jgi:hypothetical protein